MSLLGREVSELGSTRLFPSISPLILAGVLTVAVAWAPGPANGAQCKPGDHLIDEDETHIYCLTADEVGNYQYLTKRLQEQAETWNMKGDLRGGFADAHACMCGGITDKALARGFKQNRWILKLNRVFVESFFAWLKQWESRTGKGNMPKRWWLAFSRAEAIQHDPSRKDPSLPGGDLPVSARKRVTLVLAGAHIFEDIPMALRKEGCGPKDDFEAVMDVIDMCEKKILGPFTKELKDWAGRLGYPRANAIRDWRTVAWKSVCR